MLLGLSASDYYYAQQAGREPRGVDVLDEAAELGLGGEEDEDRSTSKQHQPRKSSEAREPISNTHSKQQTAQNQRWSLESGVGAEGSHASSPDRSKYPAKTQAAQGHAAKPPPKSSACSIL